MSPAATTANTPQYYLYFFLSFLPFLLCALYVSVRLWQFGHNNWRLSSELFKKFPSLWWISRGNFPVNSFFSPHPHFSHLQLFFSIKYLLMWPEILYSPFSPSFSPFFHSSINVLWSNSRWHLFEQKFFCFLFSSLPQFKQVFIFLVFEPEEGFEPPRPEGSWLQVRCSRPLCHSGIKKKTRKRVLPHRLPVRFFSAAARNSWAGPGSHRSQVSKKPFELS